jgi:hypothetical protein
MLAKLLLTAVTALAVSAPSSPTTVKEDETGVRFAVELTPPGGDPGGRTQTLLATGVREKFWIDVYAFGLYVEDVGAFEELDDSLGHKSKLSLRDVERSNDSDIPRTVRLVMVREIDAEDVREAFEDFLGARIETIREPSSRKDGLRHLKTFRDYFSQEVHDGTEMVFAWKPAAEDAKTGTLTTTIGGKLMGSIPSPELAWALFDCYVGEDAISEDACEAMARKLPTVLSAGERALEDERRAAEQEAD